MRLWLVSCAIILLGCPDQGDDGSDLGPNDGGATDRGAVVDASPIDAEAIDAAPDAAADAGSDAGGDDASEDAGEDAGEDGGDAGADGGEDAGADTGPTYNCGLFTEDPGWTVIAGFRAVVIADQQDGLNQPVAAAFAGGAFGDLLYVVNQGDDAVRTIDVLTGTVAPFTTSWPDPPSLLTAITWDSASVFDGLVYVADQGSDSDLDSTIYRIDSTGAATVFAAGPGPGLDDVYGLAFSGTSTVYPAGLYVSGDTDGALVDWGLFGANGTGTPFSEVAGIEGVVLDELGLYGGQLIAARPAGGGYAGDGSITPILPDGTATTPIATGLGGVHAVVLSPGGAFGQNLYAASWSAGTLLQISPAGVVTTIASGLALTNYDANILDFSPDGNVLFVADRLANRVVCIEPVP